MINPERLYAENKRDGISYAELGRRYGLTRNQVAGMIHRHKRSTSYNLSQFAQDYRQRHNIPNAEHLFKVELGRAWHFDDHANAVIVGDVQIPTTSYDWLALVMAVGGRYLRKPRRLIVAGDLINADAFSGYESDEPTPSFTQEVNAGRAFFREMLTVFDEVYWFAGNHERRIGKKTRAAINYPMLLSLLTHDTRVQISKWGYCTIANANGHNWRVTHARNYSVQALNVADTLAQKYHSNVIQHHEHHLGKTMDRYKRYTIINNGGLFDADAMSYAVLDDSKCANMANGFTLLRDGYAEVFGPEGYTNWGAWVGENNLRIAA